MIINVEKTKIDELANKVYSEVRIEYFDENKGCWSIDTWETDDPFEEGVVVGEIYEDERGVVYLDEEAENNPQVKETIEEFFGCRKKINTKC